jgi:DNA primase
MPLEWHEVVSGLTIKSFTIKNAAERMQKRGDPMRDVLEVKPDLLGALGKLHGVL